MTTARAALAALLLALFLPACTSSQQAAENAAVQRERVELLADWLCGSFSSAEQAAQDPDYFDIRLHMCRIWPERADGPWIYVEQARADALDQPYRQRVYRLSALARQQYRSDVYELPDPARFAGAWKSHRPLAELAPESLILKDGCSVDLEYHVCSNFFSGKTQGTSCESSLRGAKYAASEVSVTHLGIVSWDRGYDAAGKQVWGATKGGYRFIKAK